MTLDPTYFRTPFAHRGLWDASKPENSISAIKAAVNAGYGVEFDLQLSQDGVAVMFHDETIDRMTSHSGYVADFSAAQLNTFQLGNSTDTIPTFADVLKIVDGRVPMLVELKDQTKRPLATAGDDS